MSQVGKLKVASNRKNVLGIFGPGILFAASAVGLSHLVQSTRAGAEFGFGMVFIVMLACAIKYPMLRFGGEYATKTGKNLIDDYVRQGRWAFIAYMFTELSGMVIATAAVTIFTFSLIQAAFDITDLSKLGELAVLLVAMSILTSGRYVLFENISKVMVLIFAVLITVATCMVVPQVAWSIGKFSIPELDPSTLIFIVALIGVTPTIATGSVWQSLWTQVRQIETGERTVTKRHLFDFNVGFAGTTIIAVFFVIIGAELMFGKGIAVATGGENFSRQFLGLFTEVYGAWSFPVIATVSITVVFTSLLTVIDGWSRVMVSALAAITHQPLGISLYRLRYRQVLYTLCSIVYLSILAISENFTQFLDFTATVLFITSPIIATLNHRAMFNGVIPCEDGPPNYIRYWSLIGVISMTIVSIIYVYFKFLY